MLAAAALMLGAASSAHAGAWVQESCVNPAGTAAGSEGWSTVMAGGGYGSNASSNCGPGSPMYALMSSDAGVGVGAQETLRYIPPAGSTLNGGEVTLAMTADGTGYNASGTAVAYTPEYAYDGANVFFQCASGLAPCSPASNDFTGTIAIPAGRGGNLYLSAGCGGRPGAICNEGGSAGAWSSIQLSSASLRLTNTATPTGGGFSGTLLAPAARGTQDLSLTAGDPGGPGVYRVTVEADGQTLYNGTPDSNEGRCVPVGSSGGALMFDASQPCKSTEAVLEPIDTAGIADGTHTLKVTVTDAAGNSSVVYDAPISTHNAPVNSSAPTLSEIGAPALTATPGTWVAPAGAGTISYGYQWQDCNTEGAACRTIPAATASSYTPTLADTGRTIKVLVTATDRDGASTAASETGATTAMVGVANGDGASDSAQLHLTGPKALARSYAQRAASVAGQLLDSEGRPIGGATLEVREQLQGAGTATTVGFATTTANGTFTAQVNAGPSRQIVVGYRAFSNEPGYSAQATVRESVHAGVQLNVTPRRSRSTSTITLSGRVAGPIPAAGVVVELLVYYRGHWEPFRAPRARQNGRFAVHYRFEGSVGRFPFRAEIPGGQTGFPYSSGSSRPVAVETR